MSEQSDRRSGIEPLLVSLLFVGLGLGVVLIGSRTWLPSLASRHGVGIDNMLIYLLTTVGGLTLVGHLVLAYFIWRFSRQAKVSHRLASTRTERGWGLALGLVMTVVAEGGVLIIGLPVFHEYFVTDPPEEAVRVEITAEQFVWNMRYPGPDGDFGRTDPHLVSVTNPLGLDASDPAAADDILEVNNLYLPIDRPAKVTLRSKDVLHSFFLPHFRVKQDAVPGMSIPIWFVPTKEGRFEIACAELCGLAHYRMQGFVHVMAQQEFDSWLQEKQQGDA